MIDNIDIQTAKNFIQHYPFQYQFPYQPDDYQTRAFYRILLNEHVFVSVPTGAGKTTVAEFAIAKSITEGKNIIYTAPIKALCNQKFYDFQIKFNNITPTNQDDDSLFYYHNEITSNIGILTGDVKENENANCLVMTTEVLRNMIFRKNDYLNDVQWIIFDEVHYISNEERGQVWEEVIQWAPEHVRFIFLSATSPNRNIFCSWVSDCRKNQPVWIQEHSKRPIPLDFWIYFGNPSTPLTDKPTWNNGWYQITNENPQIAPRKLLEISHKPMMKKDRNGWTDLIRKLESQDMLPSVFFGFQKKRLESYAQMTGHLSLTTKKQQFKINKFIKETFDRLQLTEEHLKLPQIRMMTPLLINGIGFHHSGLLPFLKEIVEVLFANGLLKILWATETFAMGLNMPTRTVVFTDTHKWDGKKERLLDASEWLQMAGRAGRRGFDTVGYVIVPADDRITEIADLIWAQPKPMKSHFQASYSTILHGTQDDEHHNMKSFRDYLHADEIQNQQELIQRYKSLQIKINKNYPDWEKKTIFQQYSMMMKIIQMSHNQSLLRFHKIAFSQNLKQKFILVMPDEYRIYPVKCLVKEWKPTRLVQDTELQESFEISPEDIFAVCQENGKVNRKFYGKIPFDILDLITNYWDTLDLITQNKAAYPIEEIEKVQDYDNLRNSLQKLKQTLGEEDPDIIQKTLLLQELKYLNEYSQLTLKGKIAREIHSTHPILLTECLLNATFIHSPNEVCVSILSNFTVPRKSNKQNEEKYISQPPDCEELNMFLNESIKECIQKEDKFGIQSKETELWFDNYTNEYQGAFYYFAKQASFYDWTMKTGWEEGTLIRWALRTEELCRELGEIFERLGNEELQRKCEEMRGLIKRDLVQSRSIYW